MTEWYELDEQERIKQAYAKYTIKDFWDWWSDGKEKYMEVRIQGNYDLIKQVHKRLNIPYSSSGVYVRTATELKNVITLIREKDTVWFGINSRKKNINRFGTKSFGCGDKGGSSDANITAIEFIFIDIDRKNKDGTATKDDLKDANIIADKILERLSTHKWNKNYCKICSGNGLQLIIKVDYKLIMPELEYKVIETINRKQMYGYVDNKEFNKLRNIIKYGIGKEINLYVRKINKDLNAEIDLSGFNINRVGALPFTKNFKHDGYTWRGIVDLQIGKNDGLSDHILSKENNIKQFNGKNVFRKPRDLGYKYTIREGLLLDNILVKFMLENDLPYGQINNKLWFQLKCLIRDSDIKIESEEYRKLIRLLEIKYKGRFSRNLPDKKFGFSENVVNSYCMLHGLKPLYSLWPEKKIKNNLNLKIDFRLKDMYDDKIELDKYTTIMEDMFNCKIKLKVNDFNNNVIIGKFINGLISKYSEQYIKNIVNYYFDKYFNYK